MFAKARFPSAAADQPLLVGHLMATAPARARGATAASTAASILFHGAVLALAAWLTTGQVVSQPRLPGFDIVLPVEPPLPPPMPTPPPIDMDRMVPQAPVKGPVVGTLTNPIFIPDSIPTPTMGPPTDESIFTDGRGTLVGSERPAAGNDKPVVDPYEHPGTFVVMTVAPELKNRLAVENALRRLYPPMLRDAGVGGRVVVWVLVDEEGGVARAIVKEASGAAQLDAAALDVARVMRFSPAMNRDQKVKVWVAIPVQFRVGD